MKLLCDWCFENKKEHLMKEWDYEKNQSVRPDNTGFGSAKKVWWKCAQGHEWQMSINNRTSQNQHCPFCSGQRAITGKNDLQTLFPGIAREWHPTKNKGITNGHNIIIDSPDLIPAYSNVKVWWRCVQGHEWLQSVNSRTVKKCGCSYCSCRKLLSGFNDLLTQKPDIADETSYEKSRLN